MARPPAVSSEFTTWWRVVGAVTALLVVSFAVPSSADHVQNDSGTRAIAFDHRGGNEWWVEVAISGPDAFTAIGVFAHDGAGSNLYGLEKKSWGTWGGSFHIEPGHDVQFKALWTNGVTQESCWFSHPAGLEACGSTPPPPPPPSPFDATFTGVRGNEWWLQGQVAASTGYSVGTVDVRLNGGAWQPLALQSWGGWAASYHAVQGTVVQLRATATNGETDLSSCRQWIPSPNQDATIVPCDSVPPPPPPPPPPPGGFEATFSDVKGNDWWVEAKVTANEPVQGVEARLHCTSTWKPMTLRSWGAWAASFNVPSGSKVDFRATSTAGSHDVSPGYIWPEATPTPPCPDGGSPPPPPGAEWYTESFWGMKGNEWWAEIRVDSPVNGVDARAAGGDWHPLALRDWGAWAGSFHIPAGSLVQFRAHRTDGAFGFHAQGFPWPDGTPPYPGWGNCGAAFDAAFHNVKGNADYQQVNVYSTCNLEGVEVRVYDGAWSPMQRQAWGDWAATVHLNPGDRVQFRAFGGGGQEASQPIAWPPA